MTDTAIYLGIDVGGTSVKLGLVDEHARTLGKRSFATNAAEGPTQAVNRMRAEADLLLEECGVAHGDVTCCGLATPGTMDIPAGLLLDPPNLPGWDHYPVRQRVEDVIERPTYLQNDANAAAYGEYWAGAGKGVSSMVLWTLGTGIGCGIIIGGMIVRGEHSHGSECGHLIIDMDGKRKCGTGQYGTLEAYASATALVARAREALEAGRESSLRARVDAGEELTPILIGEEATNGDALADELVMDTATYLGIGTTSVMHTIDPNLFLLGGAMTFGRHETELGRRFLQRWKDEVKHRGFPIPASRITFDYASLGNDAGFIGAAGYARDKHSRDGVNP